MNNLYEFWDFIKKDKTKKLNKEIDFAIFMLGVVKRFLPEAILEICDSDGYRRVNNLEEELSYVPLNKNMYLNVNSRRMSINTEIIVKTEIEDDCYCLAAHGILRIPRKYLSYQKSEVHNPHEEDDPYGEEDWGIEDTKMTFYNHANISIYILKNKYMSFYHGLTRIYLNIYKPKDFRRVIKEGEEFQAVDKYILETFGTSYGHIIPIGVKNRRSYRVVIIEQVYIKKIKKLFI